MAKVRPISDFLQKVAIEQLNEVPERVPADIEILRTWIQQQSYLNARTDDQFLLSFLRGCKFSIEKAKAKIDKYYTMRTKYPELFNFTNVNDAKFREMLRLGPYTVLPTPLNENGPRIMIMRLGAYSPDKYTATEITNVMFVMQEILMLEDDYATVNGVIFIMDLANAGASHLFQVSPSLMKKMTIYSEEAVPLRPKGSHFLNTFKAFEPIFMMMKPMLSQKMRDRLFVHSGLESLQQQIPKKYLPKEYGGENGTIADIATDWESRIDAYSEHFKDNANYGTNEKLRPGKPIDFESIFGTDGSFRKLDVD